MNLDTPLEYERIVEFIVKLFMKHKGLIKINQVLAAGFELLSDNAFGNGMRWVSVAPSRDSETAIVFVEADTVEKTERVGNQAANHVFLVVQTDDCYRDYNTMKSKGVTFFGEPKQVPWGIEVVFEDLYGNRLDLLQHNGF